MHEEAHEKMDSFIRRHPRITLLAIKLVILGSLIVAIELVLHLYFPFHLATIGHHNSANAAKYGWGLAW